MEIRYEIVKLFNLTRFPRMHLNGNFYPIISRIIQEYLGIFLESNYTSSDTKLSIVRCKGIKEVEM